MDATTRERAQAGLKKIEHQFPSTSVGRLFFAVVERAVYDALQNEPTGESRNSYTRHINWELDRRTATAYLLYDMYHAVNVGVNPEWILRVFKSLGIDFSDLPEMRAKT